MNIDFNPQPVPSPQKPPTKFVLPETIAIVVIAGLDLLFTIYLIGSHRAREANPIFNGILENFGPIGFIVVKSLSVAIPVIIAERAREKSPKFVKNMLRLCIAAYLGLYIISFVRNNPLTSEFETEQVAP